MPIFNFNSPCQAGLRLGLIRLQRLGMPVSPHPQQHLILSDLRLLLSGEERKDPDETWCPEKTLPLSPMFRFVYKMCSS